MITFGFLQTLYRIAMAISLCAPFLGYLSAASAQSKSFGATLVPGTSVIFEPFDSIPASEIGALSANFTGPASKATPAVRALTFPAAKSQTLTILALGMINCCGGLPTTGPNGYLPNVNISSLGGISGYSGPGFALVGVFTNGAASNRPPKVISYSGEADAAPSSISINQVFFIGTGLTHSGDKRIFPVPDEATELWLGVADTFVNGTGRPSGYGDNTGAFIASGTISNCSGLFNVAAEKMVVKFNTLPFVALQGVDKSSTGASEPYLYIYSGQFSNAGYSVPYAISIDPTPGLAYKASSNPGEKPEIVIAQNLTEWSGAAYYSDNPKPQYNATIYTADGKAAIPPYRIMDAIGNNLFGKQGPLFIASTLGGRDYQPFADTPNIHIPIADQNGELTRINYTKYFKTYVGCAYPSDPVTTFASLAIISWHEVFSGTINTEYTGNPPRLRATFFPDSRSGVFGGQAKSPVEMGRPILSPPAANSVTSYIDFSGKVAGPF